MESSQTSIFLNSPLGARILKIIEKYLQNPKTKYLEMDNGHLEKYYSLFKNK
jgi:hypothetical protein